MQSAGDFQKFIDPFSQKLSQLNVASLPMSDYCKRYLQYLLSNQFYFLEIYATVLSQLMQHSHKVPGEMNLADYGSGNGLLGIFAKFAGFKKVWLCDMDAEFMNASKILAGELQLELDGYVTGTAATLQTAVGGNHLDAVVGTDVIEHIYSLEDFLATIANINPAMLTVFTTASNPDNFIKCRQLKKMQLQDELIGSNPGDAVLAGAESTEAFLLSRQKIIAEKFPSLPESDLLSLSKATRGLIKNDIIAATNEFLQTGKMPQADDDSVNTCNPFNGSWTERILSINAYHKIYNRAGFEIEVQNGFYNRHGKSLKKYVNFFRNEMVKLTGKYAAPFISIVGYKPS